MAVLLVDDGSLETQKQKLIELHRRIETQAYCCLNIGVIIEKAESLEQHLYPINSLRNLALEQAPTKLVFLVDVDFIPSDNMHEALTTPPAYSKLVKGASHNMQVFVVPAFEMEESSAQSNPQSVLPATKSEAVQLYSEKKMIGFHTKHFAPGHKATNYEKWMQSNTIYPVQYEEGFEPYIIGAKKLMPR